MASPVCSQNASVAFNYLIGKGLSTVQAAGVVGNLQVESRLDPRLEAMDTNQKMSRGIAMWQPPRWQNLLAFASNSGRDPWALDLQLDFLWYELQSSPGYGLARLMSATTPEDATVVFQNSFEHPRADLANTASRIKFANDALECLSVRPPTSSLSGGGVLATAGLLVLMTAVGYGAYKVIEARTTRPAPKPYFPPYPERIPVSFRRET